MTYPAVHATLNSSRLLSSCRKGPPEFRFASSTLREPLTRPRPATLWRTLPTTQRHVRWCERSENESRKKTFVFLLLDCWTGTASGNLPSAVPESLPPLLYQASYEFFPVSLEHVYHRYLHHGVAARLLLHRSPSHIHENLGSEGGVVDFHRELEELVVRAA